MYLRVTHGRYHRDHEAAILRLAREVLLPNARLLPGFRGFQVGIDREAGRLVGVTVWETREYAEALAAGRGPFEALGVEFEAPLIYALVASA